MLIVCLDLEGVLVPEVWLAVAKATSIEALRLTTRDVSDYDELMRHRIRVLAEHGITLRDIQQVIAGLSPLPGAREFLDELRERRQVVLLSDTFEQFAHPLMRQLAWPTLLCNQLEVDESGTIVGYTMRARDGKRTAVEGFQAMGLTVFAAGDSYNDLAMIRAADFGALYCPPESIRTQVPQIPVAYDHDELMEIIDRL